MQVSPHYFTSYQPQRASSFETRPFWQMLSDISLCFQLAFPWLLTILSNFTCSCVHLPSSLCLLSLVLFVCLIFWCREFFKYSGYNPFVRCTYFNVSLSLWFAFLYSQCGVLMNRGFQFWSPVCQYFLLWLCFHWVLSNLCWSQVHEDILMLCIMPGTFYSSSFCV